jgi:hypothetical protein
MHIVIAIHSRFPPIHHNAIQQHSAITNHHIITTQIQCLQINVIPSPAPITMMSIFIKKIYAITYSHNTTKLQSDFNIHKLSPIKNNTIFTATTTPIHQQPTHQTTHPKNTKILKILKNIHQNTPPTKNTIKMIGV